MTVRYYISSDDLTAEKFATAIQNQWHVENKLHWRLDVVMNEDDCKIRRGNAAELFSGIRHIAINILTNDKVFKAGLRCKMLKAAMDRNYLGSFLVGRGGFRNLLCYSDKVMLFILSMIGLTSTPYLSRTLGVTTP